MPKKVIYFLCTGNSCRSQMAEGFGKKYLGSAYEVRSAGIEAHGVNPMAVQAMQAVGIDISQQRSKLIDEAELRQADMIVTLCGDAEERCPLTPPRVRREHWGFPDPAKVQGTTTEKWAAFEKVRDGIEKSIREFAATESDRNE